MYIELITYECWVCGVPFGISQSLRDNIREKNGTLFCPKGCRLGLGESDYSKLKKQKEQAERDLQAALNEANHAKLVAQRERDKAIKDKRKVERRIAHGVCPCCNQTFADIANHMLTEHKDFRLPSGKKPKEIAAA